MKDKPIIGLTSNLYEIEGIESTIIYLQYSEAVKKAGGIPIIFPIGDEEMAKVWISMVDGVLLTGGIDVHPTFYGEEPSENLGVTDERLDESDLAVISEARKQKKPIFGICRGSHLINVAFGGTLHQHLDDEDPIRNLEHLSDVERPETVHEITIEKDTRFHEIVKKDKAKVNSFHHQGVKKLGGGLRRAAKAEDGLIEAFEGKAEPIIGTQFHPEELSEHDFSMERLLKYFVSMCK